MNKLTLQTSQQYLDNRSKAVGSMGEVRIPEHDAHKSAFPLHSSCNFPHRTYAAERLTHESVI